MKPIVDTLLVSVNLPTNGDTAILLVGRKRPNEAVEIVNAFQEKEAIELYNRLVTVKKGE